MSINQAFESFKNWNITNSDLALWVFRKNRQNGDVSYTAKCVNADARLLNELAAVFISHQKGYSETIPYDVLSQPLESQLLHIESHQTHLNLLTDKFELPCEENEVSKVEHLENIVGYALRIQKGTHISYAFKKSEKSWKSKASNTFLNTIYINNELTLVDDRAFRLETQFDFITYQDFILINNKKSFESLMDYRDGFQESFKQLVKTDSFEATFSSTNEIMKYVGSNMLQLRRMESIKQKKLYLNANFLKNVERLSIKNNWGLQFSSDGKIDPTPETMSTIITILLDHRLKSELTETTYDVPSATKIY